MRSQIKPPVCCLESANYGEPSIRKISHVWECRYCARTSECKYRAVIRNLGSRALGENSRFEDKPRTQETCTCHCLENKDMIFLSVERFILITSFIHSYLRITGRHYTFNNSSDSEIFLLYNCHIFITSHFQRSRIFKNAKKSHSSIIINV